MAKIPTVTVQVILKFDELEEAFQEWMAEQPKDEMIEDAVTKFLEWMKERKLKSLTLVPLPLRERGEQ